MPIIQLLLVLVSSLFSQKTLQKYYQSHANQLNFSDKTLRNLLNRGNISWQSLLVTVAHSVIQWLSHLTSDEQSKVFIIDDSIYSRAKSKKSELVALLYNHATDQYLRGLRFLQLGWSDGHTFVPVNFALLSGKSKRVEPTSMDQRTISGKRKAQALRKETDVAVELIEQALKQGVRGDYVLFDSWFSSPKMFERITSLGLHAIGMVKKTSKVHYLYQGKEMNVKQIYKLNRKRRGRSRYQLEVMVTIPGTEDRSDIPAKLIYVRNRNNRKDYLVLLSTDVNLSPEEVINTYAKRWNIEVYFKMCKQHLQLSKYQGTSYDGIFAHTTLVCLAYLVLAVTHRESIDNRTIGNIFYMMVDELQAMPYERALMILLTYFAEHIVTTDPVIESEIDTVIQEALAQLPNSLRSALLQ